MQDFDLQQDRAFQNVFKLRKQGASLPDQILENKWPLYFFFGDDTIFGSFATRVRELLLIEGSHTCCMVDFRHSGSPANEAMESLEMRNAATIFINAETSEDAFLKEINVRRPHFSWVTTMGDYGCTSDLGNWYVYTERTNEVSFVAFRDSRAFESYREVIKSMGAEPIEEFSRLGSKSNPYSGLNSVWTESLLKNYRNDSANGI